MTLSFFTIHSHAWNPKFTKIITSSSLLVPKKNNVNKTTTHSPNTLCVTPNLRKSWRRLSELEKQKYLLAYKKLKLENKEKFGNDYNLDDFVKIHLDHAFYTHSTVSVKPPPPKKKKLTIVLFLSLYLYLLFYEL